jgi:hypothetical protein
MYAFFAHLQLVTLELERLYAGIQAGKWAAGCYRTCRGAIVLYVGRASLASSAHWTVPLKRKVQGVNFLETFSTLKIKFGQSV